MNAPSPGPAYTELNLVGPADEVAALLKVLSGSAEVIFGPVLQPARAGNVSCTAQLVTHPTTGHEPARQSVSATVQVTFEVEPGTPVGPPGSAAAEQVESSVAAAVSSLPGVQGTTARLVTAVGLPTARD